MAKIKHILRGQSNREEVWIGPNFAFEAKDAEGGVKG